MSQEAWCHIGLEGYDWWILYFEIGFLHDFLSTGRGGIYFLLILPVPFFFLPVASTGRRLKIHPSVPRKGGGELGRRESLYSLYLGCTVTQM